MKIMIQHLKTGLFLTADADWTSRDKLALQFENSAAAADYCGRRHFLHNAAIVFRFRNPRHDMVFKANG